MPETAVGPGFLAGFRARRDAWQERVTEAASWRWLALRLAPLSAVAAAAALVLVLPGGRVPPPPPVAGAAAPAVPEVPDPFAAGPEEVGVATLAMSGDAADHELLAVLYEPIGTD